MMLALAALVVPAAFGNDSPGDVGKGSATNTGPTVGASANNPGKPGKPGKNPTRSFTDLCGTPEKGVACAIPVETPSPHEIARRVYAEMVLPQHTPVFGPPPDQNEWGMIPVGYPIWLWATNDTITMSHSATEYGLTVALTAKRLSVAFNMGDGKVKRCTAFTKRPAKLTGDPMKTSPTCGYVYTKPGKYRLSATTTWLILWEAGGDSGSFTVALTAEAKDPLVIGELLTVITPGRLIVTNGLGCYCLVQLVCTLRTPTL